MSNHLDDGFKAHAEHADDIDVEKAKHDGGDLHGDAGLKVLGEQRVELTEEDVSFSGVFAGHAGDADWQNRRIRRKTDKTILTILIWVYFLQIFDKVVFGLGNVFGLSEDIHLTGEFRRVSPSRHPADWQDNNTRWRDRSTLLLSSPGSLSPHSSSSDSPLDTS